MGRAKLPLQPITKDRYRNTTFQKRKNGLFKKAYEFSTLCGVDACVITYGPKSVETWPSDPAEVRRILHRSAGCRSKHSQDLSDFFLGRKSKIEREILKLRKKNWQAEYKTWDSRLDLLPENQLRQLVGFLEAKLEAAARMLHIKNGEKELASLNKMLGIGGGVYGRNYPPLQFPTYNIDEGLLGKRLDMETHFNDIEEKLPEIDASSCSNFQYYNPQLGGAGGDAVAASNGRSFQYYTTLLSGGGGGDVVPSYGGDNLQYYTVLGGVGGDVGFSNGISLQYYTILGGGGDAFSVGENGGSIPSNGLIYNNPLLENATEDAQWFVPNA